MKLLPCPFCGLEPVSERTGFSLRAMYIYCINDNGCPRPKAIGESEEKAIENWNTRHSPAVTAHTLATFINATAEIEYNEGGLLAKALCEEFEIRRKVTVSATESHCPYCHIPMDAKWLCISGDAAGKCPHMAAVTPHDSQGDQP